MAAIVSYVEDPGGAFSGGTFEGDIADLLLAGHNVSISKNFDERLLQKKLIQKDQRQMDVIVLGSSRSFQITQSTLGNEFKNRTFFNNAVSSAKLSDNIGILELYIENKKCPNTILIGVDPWVLNAKFGGITDSIKNEYQTGLARFSYDRFNSGLNLDFFNNNRYFYLISRPVVINSINLRLNIQNRSQKYTELNESSFYIKETFGSVIFHNAIRNRTIEQVDVDARKYAHCDDDLPIAALGDFTQLDGNLKNQFESTIRYFKNRNVTIILFLPAQHPILQNKTAQDPRYSQVKESELYFKKFAASENITIIGSYDPYQMNLTSADFYDGSHLRREAIDRIFAAEIIGKNVTGGR
ncbi:MAG: hypothetical protein STSR0009_25660 [Methanoregula sp.]